MSSLQDILEFPIDFKGQEKANSIAKLSYLSVPLSFIAGFLSQDIFSVILVFGVVQLLVFVAVLPNWPFYNKNPVNWLKVEYDLGS